MTSCGKWPRRNRKVGWQRIVAIIDGRGPIKVPEIPRVQRSETSACRRRRTDRPPAAAAADPPTPINPSNDGAAQVSAVALESLNPPESAGIFPSFSGPSSAAAAPTAIAPADRGKIIDFPRSSSKHEHAKISTASGGVGGNQPPPDGEIPSPRGPPDNGDNLDLRLAFYPQTDLGNAERFRERYRDQLLCCQELGWLWWNGKCWSRDGADDMVKKAEHETVRAIQREAKALENSDRNTLLGTRRILGVVTQWYASDALAAWGRTSEAAQRLAPIAKRVTPYLAVAAAKLDTDPFKFNVANGTLHISKDVQGYITFRPHDPADLITKCSPVAYDAAATCPVFDDFFSYVQPKIEVRRFLLAWQGLSLTGDVSEQKLAVFWGGGKNGKSTFIDVVAYIAGDYAATVPIETFLADSRTRTPGQATPDLATLPGVRYLHTSEPEKGAKLAEALIKLATGGDPILARHLNRDFFKFYPQFKLTISGNYRPTISGADEGMWRRVELVPWTVTVPDKKRDPHLAAKLRNEGPGILNRLLDGLRDYLDNGLVEPASVQEATAEYRADSDPVGRFIADCTAVAENGRIQSSLLHEVYTAWAGVNGGPIWSMRGLTGALVDRRWRRTKSGNVFWIGYQLTKSINDFVDHDGKPLKATEATDTSSTPHAKGEDDVVDF
jgi:putative DNA primase/helicase